MKHGTCHEKLQASCKENANKIVEQAACKRNILNILIDLATIAIVADDTKPTEDELHTFHDAWNHPNAKS